MAARSSVVATTDVTVVTAYGFGGTNSRKRKCLTVQIVDATANAEGWVIGGTDGDIPATAFGLSVIESCSNVNTYTVSTGATTNIVSAAPSLAGAGILLSDSGDTAGGVSDQTIASGSGMQITVVGY
jgi:hypothetical protein